MYVGRLVLIGWIFFSWAPFEAAASLAVPLAMEHWPRDNFRSERLEAEGLRHLENGTLDEAEPLFQRALRINEKVLGPYHPSLVRDLNNLARLYQTQGRYRLAEHLLKEAALIREKALGPENPAVAESLNSLAVLYKKQA
ncbi:MAG TPA: tetratricopeptide repeat protein, partial [Candidatus Binatia bacterium]